MPVRRLRQAHPLTSAIGVACAVLVASVGFVSVADGPANAADTLQAVTFGCTGAPQTWVVPTGVTTVTFDVFGAGGGRLVDPRFPNLVFGNVGKGGEIKATTAVVPGQVFSLQVGCAGLDSQPDPNALGGAGGFGGGASGGAGADTVPVGSGSTGGGGGGGGASAVSSNSVPVLVAGGGGGSGAIGCFAGTGSVGAGGNGSGGPNATAGNNGANGGPCDNPNAAGGGGATGNTGGTAGTVGDCGPPCANGTAGSAGAGGGGGAGYDGGGGGGGGYFGGGGGGGTSANGNDGGSGGGGGGNGFADPNTTVLATNVGLQRGNGAIRVTIGTIPANPTVSVGDQAILEGADGTRTLKFPVTLSEPATTTVTVDYAVTGDSATGGPKPAIDVDFKLKTGTLTFIPAVKTGKTGITKTIAVTLYGDTMVEADETLHVTLSNPSGPYLLGRGGGTGSILNDDGIAPGATLGLGDTSVVNASSGSQGLKIPLTLSSSPANDVSVNYTVTPGTATYSKRATGGGEFGGKLSGTVTFVAGRPAAKIITLPLWAGPNVGNDETFTVTISSVSDSSITVVRVTGTGTIING